MDAIAAQINNLSAILLCPLMMLREEGSSSLKTVTMGFSMKNTVFIEQETFDHFLSRVFFDLKFVPFLIPEKRVSPRRDILG